MHLSGIYLLFFSPLLRHQYQTLNPLFSRYIHKPVAMIIQQGLFSEHHCATWILSADITKHRIITLGQAGVSLKGLLAYSH